MKNMMAKKAWGLALLLFAVLEPHAEAQITLFDYPTGAIATFGSDISDDDRIVGIFTTAANETRGFVRLADGTFSDPMIHPGDNRGATTVDSINAAGMVAGDFLHYDETNNVQTYHGYTYNGSTFTTYDVPGAVSTSIFGINDAGHFAGTFEDATQFNQAFLQTATGLSTFAIAGSMATFGLDINNHNEVVGQYTDANGVVHGYRRTADGTLTTIDVPDAVFTTVNGTNDSGWVVGSYQDSLGVTHGFLNIAGNFSTFDIPDAISTDIYGVNNRGVIVGSFTDSSGATRGFAAPVPAPSSGIIMALGWLALMGYGWARSLVSRKSDTCNRYCAAKV